MFNLNLLKKYYNDTPQWMKNIYGKIPFSIRNGKEYRKWIKFLNEDISLEEYELLKLRETMFFAYENIPYYRKIFEQLDAVPNDFRTRKELQLFPVIDKEMVKNHFNELHVNNMPQSKFFYVTTGGSSGTPMKFLQSKNVWAKEVAFIMNYFNKYGFTTNMLKASFRGGDFSDLPKNVYWKQNPHASEIHFSPFHINDDTIKYYVSELNRRKIKYLQAYPSSLKLLIENMKKNHIKLDYQIDTVFLFSENILESDIQLIKTFFNCRLSSLYGHTERLIFAESYREDLSTFKIDRRYGLFELIDENTNTIDTNNILGEMIGTSFDNYSMPLIRYKTGDFSSYADNKNYVIDRIEGRWKQEYLLGKNGEKLYLTALNMHSDVFKNVIKYQFIQQEAGEAEIHIQVNELFTSTDKVNILNTLQKKAGHAINFEIKFVNNFMLTHRGKFSNIVKKF